MPYRISAPFHISLTSFLLVLLSLSGCGSSESYFDTRENPPASTDSPPVLSMRDIQEVRKALAKYHAFYVEPVQIYSEDSGRLVPTDSSELENLADSFREKIIRALEGRATVFNQPARSTAILRVAITNVWSTRAITNLRPGILVPNALQGGASMEAEVIDSITGKRVALIYDSRKGTRHGFLTGLTTWGGTEAAFDEWALLLKRSVG